MSSERVYVVEPTMDVSTAFALVRESSGDSGYVYIPKAVKQAALAEMIAAEGSKLVVLPFDTINSAYDEELFGFAQKLAARAIAGVDDPQLRWAFYVQMQSNLVAALRPVEQLRFALKGDVERELVWVSAASTSSPLRETLQSAFPRMVNAHEMRSPRVASGIVGVLAGCRTNVPNPEQLQKAICSVARRRSVCLSGNLRDQRYRDVVLPIIKRLLEDAAVVVLPTSAEGPGSFSEFLEEHDLRDRVRNGDLHILDTDEVQKPSPIDERTVSECIQIGRRVLRFDTEYTAYERMYGALTRDLLVQQAPVVLARCRALWGPLLALTKACDVAVVSPGRPLRSLMMVAAAKASGKRSVEIQSGTTSTSKRFVCPAADELLVIDEESERIFRHHGKKSGIRIVGSPRLDYDLAAYRSMSKAEARLALGLPTEGPIWMLATQPVGTEYMEQVADLVMTAAASTGAAVLIKLHPNETNAHEASYRRVGARHPSVGLFINRTANSAVGIAASDAVFTYFSTVGIESHALGRVTVSVNPFDEPLRFDLAKVGVAQEAKTADDILRIVAAGTQGIANSFLTDGMASERSVKIILEAAKSAPQLQWRPAARRAAKRAWRRLPSPMKKPLGPIARRLKKLVDTD